ncbi:hypothetical protein KC362_g4 [Hortaea werneckii]|nr:hypothetical protein KC362_g4 [Hortaea werneckii]
MAVDRTAQSVASRGGGRREPSLEKFIVSHFNYGARIPSRSHSCQSSSPLSRSICLRRLPRRSNCCCCRMSLTVR